MASPCYDDFFVSTSENHYLVSSDSADKNPHPHRPSHTCQHWLGRHSHCQRLTTAAIIRHRPEMHNTEKLNAVTPRGTTPDKRSEICQILLTGAIYLWKQKVSSNCQTRVNEHLNWLSHCLWGQRLCKTQPRTVWRLRQNPVLGWSPLVAKRFAPGSAEAP